MSKKMMSPNSTVWWIPLAGVANYLALSAAEVTAGTNMSAAITTGYKLGSTASDTSNTRDITQESNVEFPTFGNYEGELSFFRSDKVAVTALYDTVFALFKVPRAQGYLVHRLGYKSTVAAAATQEVSIYAFTADAAKDMDGDKGAPIQFSIKYRPLGKKKTNFALV